MNSLRFNVDSVLPYMKQVASVVTGKNSLVIFDNIRIRISGGLRLKASDGETWIEQVVTDGVAYDTDIDCCVNAKTLVSTFDSLAGKDVEIILSPEKLLLNIHYGKNNKITLPYKNGADFIDEDPLQGDVKSVMVNAKTFLTAISMPKYAVANDELRPVLNGVHIDFTQAGGIECAASDGVKLAYYSDKNVNISNDHESGLTLPSKPLQLASSMIETVNGNDFIELFFTQKAIQIKSAYLTMTSRLCEGRYPNYKAVIPQANNNILTVNRNAILETLQRILPLGSFTSKLVRVDLMPAPSGYLRLATDDIDYSTSATEEIDGQYYSYDGSPMSIGFKGDNLIQSIKNIQDEQIRIELLESSTAAVLKPVSKSELTDYTAILMPLKID